MKKIAFFLALSLVLALIFSTQAYASNGTYKDVYESDWFVDDVRYVHNLALLEATTNGEFSPSVYATRGEIIEALYRLEGTPAVGGEVDFDDLPAESKNFSAVSWAVENGIINGYGNGRVGVKDNVTREQLVTVLSRYATVKGLSEKKADLSKYKDLGEVSVWAMDAFSWSNAMGLIKGTSDITLSPKGTTTRAEVSAVIHRLGLLIGVNYFNDSFVASVREPVFVLVEKNDTYQRQVLDEVYTYGEITSYTYDKAGKYTSKKIRMWNTGSYVECYFNEADQIIRASKYATYTGEPILGTDIFYTYDERGKLASAKDALSSWSKTYTTTYDEEGRTKTTTELIPSDLYGTREEELTYYYTDTGYYTTCSFLVGYPAKADISTRVYDLNGRLLSRSSATDGVFSQKTDFTYDEEGRLSTEHYLMPGLLDDSVTSYTYNVHGDLVETIVQGTHYGEPYYSKTTYTNTYDEYGNLVSRYEDRFGITTTYTWEQIK